MSVKQSKTAESTHRPRVVIAGSGNVATHLARALAPVVSLDGIWSRNAANAKALAAQTDTRVIDNTDDIPADTDLVIISVVDDAVAAVAAMIPPIKGTVCHTSGSVPVTALSMHARAGVFYPMQTFSKARTVDMSEVPFFIEGSDSLTATRLYDVASLISRHVSYADSEARARLHLGAVFACNFANEMWRIADDILAGSGCGLSVYRSLIRETLDKSIDMGPRAARTGPAARRDTRVMRRQLQALAASDKTGAEEQQLYTLLSTMISGLSRKSIFGDGCAANDFNKEHNE